jgi:hypothetical protein
LTHACNRVQPRSRRAAEQHDELAALHSITSSAQASSVGGTSRPSAVAVCKFTINRISLHVERVSCQPFPPWVYGLRKRLLGGTFLSDCFRSLGGGRVSRAGVPAKEPSSLCLMPKIYPSLFMVRDQERSIIGPKDVSHGPELGKPHSRTRL